MNYLLRQHWEVLVFAVFAVCLPLWPAVDLAASSAFYRPGVGFFLRDLPPVQLIHHGIPSLATSVSVLLAGVFVLGFLPLCDSLRRHRRPAAYLLLVLLVGPGLLVNGLFKSHWGRARPADVTQFGGDKTFTPPLLPAGQCRHNCSFVSGHAAFGFALCALGFLRRERAWFGLAFAVGSLWGLARLVHGKHFLSDIVFAFFAVYFCAKLLHFLMYDRASPFLKPWVGSAAPARPALAAKSL